MAARRWTILLLACLLFSGCAGATETKQGGAQTGGPAPSASVSADSGSVTGTVVNDENAPIVGARVGIPSAQLETATVDASGAFTLNNVPPGTHSVFAEQLGYEAKALRVTVNAGEVATVNFVLTPIATPGQARQLNYVGDGFVELAIVIPVVGVYNGNATGLNLNFIAYNVARDAANVVWGLTWESTVPLTGRLVRMNTLPCKISSCNPQAPTNFTRGLSPIVIRTEDLQETIKDKEGYSVASQFYPTTCQAISTEFCLQNPDTITAVTVHQRYKLYTSVFFVEPAPPDFSPLP